MFLNKLSEKSGLPEGSYRLPTEAQWEYACRAGSTASGSLATARRRLDDYAWYKKNSEKKTHPVGQKKANGWGLYDVHGNVWEWCADWYDKDYYKVSPLNDPPGPPLRGSHRVLRGGSWSDPAGSCRSASPQQPRARHSRLQPGLACLSSSGGQVAEVERTAWRALRSKAERSESPPVARTGARRGQGAPGVQGGALANYLPRQTGTQLVLRPYS